jgi:AAA+ superfamily predicted ATPase
MNKPPKNPINPKKNLLFCIKDISNNDPFLDSSGNIFINPLFDPLHGWEKNKKTLLLKDTDNSNNNIKKKGNSFTMRLDSIIDDIRNERKRNAQNIKTDNLFKLKKTLNDQSNPKKQISFNATLNARDALDDLLLQITKKYDLANNSSLNSKQIVSRKKTPPPPPPFPRFVHKRSSSIYMPPNKAWDIPLPAPPPEIKKELKIIDREVNGIADLLELIKDNPISPYIEYNINMESIHNIKEPLFELNKMIGMNGLKDSIVDQIIYFVQNLHINKDAVNHDFMHTCIYGPPGTGKTEIAKIMGKIFSSLGILKKKYFKKVTRADLIAGYLGQTAIKTRDVIKEALGGVLFIDEAYALGNKEKRDSFAKECIDTLCEGLSDHKGQLMVIIAGYEKDLKNCFFAYNQGLNSRFPWRFNTDDYNGSELNKIFQKKINDAGWSLKEEIPDKWFESKMDTFTFYGRDMETLLSKTKIAHGRRVFCKPKEEKMKLTMKDIKRGYDMFIDNNEVKERNNKNGHIEHMYL